MSTVQGLGVTELPLVPEEDGWEYQTMRYGEEEVSSAHQCSALSTSVMMMIRL